MGALKAALTAIFQAHGDNDFGSTSKVPYFDSSNNPYGMATPAKLASVLGAQVTTNPSDLYNLPHVGLYYWNSQSESPSNAAVPQGSLVQYTEYGSIKILKQYANSGNVYVNLKWGNNNWKGWQVDYNGYMLSDSAILAPLASALGGQSIVIPANSDLNNYKTSGDYGSSSAADTATITNRPPNAPSNAFAMTVINMGTTYKFQFYRVSNAAGTLFVYIRSQYGGSGAWTPWNQMSLTALT